MTGFGFEGAPSEYVQKGVDSRLVKWRKRLADAVPGSKGYTSALAMVRQLEKDSDVDFSLEEAREILFGNRSERLSILPQNLQPREAYTYHNPSHVHYALPTEGQVYFAPPGKPSEFPWELIGYAEEDGLSVTQTDTPTTPASFGSEETVTVNKFDSNASADQLEQAALNMAAQAQAIREFDALEPEGDEPTISFAHTFRRGETEYTFVAFKAANGNWYITGQAPSLSWRELGSKYPAVAEGRFHVATGWEWQGGDDA